MSRIEELKRILTENSEAYYNGAGSGMSNYDFDALIEEYKALTGEDFEVGSKATDKLPKVKHEYEAKSLAKTKNLHKIISKMKEANDTVTCAWKEDGGTLVITYDNGEISLIVTRGDAFIGNDVSYLKGLIDGLPTNINDKTHFVVRGEVVLSYDDFDIINNSLPEGKQPYDNPRNLGNATMMLFDDLDTIKERHLQFKAFNLVHTDATPSDFDLSRFDERLDYLSSLGFGVVEHKTYDADDLEKAVDDFNPEKYNIPVDGLVFTCNNYDLSIKQTGTEHHPHVWNGYALKWKDELFETVLRGILWKTKRTGDISQTAIFDTVRIEMSDVSQATLHNLNFIFDNDLKIGDRIKVFKANKIIPNVQSNMDKDEKYLEQHKDDILLNAWSRYGLPKECPACGCSTVIKTSASGVHTLHCPNASCSSKHIDKLVHFCDRTNMNIQGVSEAKMADLVGYGFISKFVDIYELANIYGRAGNLKDIAEMEGWGEVSVKNMVDSINASRNTTFVQFISAIGIPGIGHGQAKVIKNYYNSKSVYKDYFYQFYNDCKDGFDFSTINKIGTVLDSNIHKWFNDNFKDNAVSDIDRLVHQLTFIDDDSDMVNQDKNELILAGKVFVITGDVFKFKNRNALQEKIESLGGKCTGSVSKKTSYLINNDFASESSKNKKAKSLGIPIITEDEFIKMIK